LGDLAYSAISAEAEDEVGMLDDFIEVLGLMGLDGLGTERVEFNCWEFEIDLRFRGIEGDLER
jgi:hypothetical protein